MASIHTVVFKRVRTRKRSKQLNLARKKEEEGEKVPQKSRSKSLSLQLQHGVEDNIMFIRRWKCNISYLTRMLPRVYERGFLLVHPTQGIKMFNPTLSIGFRAMGWWNSFYPSFYGSHWTWKSRRSMLRLKQCILEDGYRMCNRRVIKKVIRFLTFIINSLTDILSNCISTDIGIVATAVPIINFQIAHCEFIVK